MKAFAQHTQRASMSYAGRETLRRHLELNEIAAAARMNQV